MATHIPARRAVRLPTQTRRELTTLVAKRERLQAIEIRAAIAQAYVADLIEALLDEAIADHAPVDQQQDSTRWAP